MLQFLSFSPPHLCACMFRERLELLVRMEPLVLWWVKQTSYVFYVFAILLFLSLPTDANLKSMTDWLSFSISGTSWLAWRERPCWCCWVCCESTYTHSAFAFNQSISKWQYQPIMFVCVLQGARGNDGAAGAAGPPVSHSLKLKFFPELQNTVFSVNIHEHATLSFAYHFWMYNFQWPLLLKNLQSNLGYFSKWKGHK